MAFLTVLDLVLEVLGVELLVIVETYFVHRWFFQLAELGSDVACALMDFGDDHDVLGHIEHHAVSGHLLAHHIAALLARGRRLPILSVTICDLVISSGLALSEVGLLALVRSYLHVS